MELMTLLTSAVSDVDIGLFGQTFEVYLNWIGKIIRWIIGVGSVGVGIILFSLVLKFIVLPFDVYQRIAMRKQNLKMKEQQSRMEKLQKQYANNKELYNQKVMELYKENGISMFSSCLPMILSMVIFIVAINAFNAYSQYSNIDNYNTMVQAYNTKIEEYCADLEEENTVVSVDGDKIYVTNENKFIYYTVNYVENYQENDYAYIKNVKTEDRIYKIDAQKALANADIKTFVDAKVAEAKTENEAMEGAPAFNETEATETALKNYFISQAQDAVVVSYENKVKGKTSFLWIKNIWATDASYKHPVLEYSEFKTEIEREKFNINGEKVSLSDVTNYTNVYKEDTYKIVTNKLGEQKTQANGYYILILLSIGTILLQQFVSMRSQKEQQKYSTVDGQGASQQKMMMIMMTGMFAIFSFMYSSAFSIYMITSNIFSLLSTLIINKAVDTVQEKKERIALQEKQNQRYPGYKAKQENADKKNKNKK